MLVEYSEFADIGLADFKSALLFPERVLYLDSGLFAVAEGAGGGPCDEGEDDVTVATGRDLDSLGACGRSCFGWNLSADSDCGCGSVAIPGSAVDVVYVGQQNSVIVGANAKDPFPCVSRS